MELGLNGIWMGFRSSIYMTLTILTVMFMGLDCYDNQTWRYAVIDQWLVLIGWLMIGSEPMLPEYEAFQSGFHICVDCTWGRRWLMSGYGSPLHLMGHKLLWRHATFSDKRKYHNYIIIYDILTYTYVFHVQSLCYIILRLKQLEHHIVTHYLSYINPCIDYKSEMNYEQAMKWPSSHQMPMFSHHILNGLV
jgi:hypothetical protein